MMGRSSSRDWAAANADVGRDRLFFVLLAFLLTAFGLLMIYSASSIVALTSEASNHNPGYYAIRQFVYAIAGTVLAIVASRFDYHTVIRWLLIPLWVVIVILLGLILFSSAGADAYGATRWISIGPVHLQPSEFAKGVLILGAASIIQDYRDTNDFFHCGIQAAWMLGIPLVLILREPDKGTVLTIGLTIALMMFIAGLPLKIVAGMLGFALIGILALALWDDYSRARIAILLDPWSDEYGDGYQLIQGLYAFGSGGIFGVGIGNSRQKYSYLPMAYNDFIYAVIGEELGLVGTLSVLLLFLALVFVGYRIAKAAPDLAGRLIAAGSVSMLGIQMLINVCGVLALIPLSGKPIPFLSYGGSSIMSTLILVGLVLSVARTAQAAGSSSAFVVHEGTGGRGFRIIEGGASASPDDLRSVRDASQRLGGTISYNPNGTRRINLGPSAGDRLRSRDASRGGRG